METPEVGLRMETLQRLRAEESLRESEEFHRLIAELTSDYAYTNRIHPDGRFEMESATAGFSRVTGYTVQELEERGGWTKLIHPADIPRLLREQVDLLAGKRYVSEARILTRDGEVRWIRFSVHPIWDAEEGRVVRLLGAVQEITDRKQAEVQLQAYAGQLQALSRRLLEVQEQERRAFARELHDEIGQVLTGFEFTLERSRGLPAAQVADSLAQMQALVRELTARVRDLSLRLRPTMLDDLGLLPTLLWHMERFRERTEVRVHFSHAGLDQRFNPEVETAAYRIIQEALTNIARHARVESASVRAWRDEETLYLLVEDRGVGFEEGEVRAAAASSGLSGMQERAALLGGRLQVESRPGAGTRITAELPLQAEQARSANGAQAHARG
jgi:PAS domain S-box-containing protein